MLLNKVRRPMALLAALLLSSVPCAWAEEGAAQPLPGPTQPAADASPGYSSSLTLRPADSSAVKQENGVWKTSVDPTDRLLRMKWTCEAPAVSFKLRVLDLEYRLLGEEKAVGVSGSIVLPASALDQQLMVQLWAYDLQGQDVATTQINVLVSSASGSGGQDSGSQGGGWGGQGGSRPSWGGMGGWGGFGGFGSWGSRGGSTGVTPGVGIGSGHADGNGSLAAFNTVSILPAEGEMTLLTLDGSCLPVQLTNGGAFTASAENGAVTLTPAGEADGWQIDGSALSLLHRSGVDCLTLSLNGEATTIPTDYEPQGVVYTQLRVDGCTPSDFVWTLTADGLTAAVNDRTYTVQDGRLHLKEE